MTPDVYDAYGCMSSSGGRRMDALTFHDVFETVGAGLGGTLSMSGNGNGYGVGQIGDREGDGVSRFGGSASNGAGGGIYVPTRGFVQIVWSGR